MKGIVGIITMHRVQNFGSALQAYALQKKVCDLGYPVELIDYLYPNAEHCAKQGTKYQKESAFLLRIKGWLASLVLFFGIKKGKSKAQKIQRRLKRNECFQAFYARYFRLSPHQYVTQNSIKKRPPQYDIYMTGSDQVWNPRFAVGDDNFMLAFAPPQAVRVAYAASFSTTQISVDLQSVYLKNLQQYQMIGVREESGKALAALFSGKPAEWVCDPTLLLTKEEWYTIDTQKPLVNKPYLLIYVLHYAYDPYPQIMDIIQKLKQEIHLDVVVLGGLKKGYSIPGAVEFHSVGPLEFVNLFRYATGVITTSFHGTAFALNFEKPFYSVIQTMGSRDSRMLSLLQKCGAEERALLVTETHFTLSTAMSQTYARKLQNFRAESILVLQQMLSLQK